MDIDDLYNDVKWYFLDDHRMGYLYGSNRSDFAKLVHKAVPLFFSDGVELGKTILTNSSSIIKELKALEEQLLEELSDFEGLIEDRWESVMISAKEDVDEENPEDVDDEDVYDVYKPEEIWQWWVEEWRHNLQDEKFAKYVSEKDFDFKDFMRHERHIPSVFMPILSRIEKEITKATRTPIEIIKEIHEIIQQKLFELYEAIFTDSNFELQK